MKAPGRHWLGVAALAIGLIATGSAGAATITIVNQDGAGEGFNDPSPRAPEGGNAGVTLGQQRLNVFQSAAAVWAARLQSNIEIKVGAQFNSLTPCSSGGGVLGSAGPNGVVRDFTNAPQANTWYHIALGESLANSNFNGTNVEINTTFNSDIDAACLGPGTRWWYGTDPAIPPASVTVSLFPVVLHELAHGLGFSTFVCTRTIGCGPMGNEGSVPQGSLLDGRNDSWVPLLRDLSQLRDWSAMTNPQRAASMTNDPNLVWNGAQVTAAIPTFAPTGLGVNGGRMRMHAPNPVQPGSSVSHFTSAATNPNLLMEPTLSAGLFNQTDMTVPLFRDIGWQIMVGANQPPVITRPASITVTEDVASSITGISVADPDAGSGSLTMTFSVGAGAFNNPGCANVTSGGTASARTLAGTLSNLNACLASGNVRYTTAPNATASFNLTVTANDNGNTGTGGAQSDTESVTVNITAVNDPPVNSVPASIAVTEDVATGLSGISFADADIASGNLQVTLGVPSGTINFPLCTGVTTSGTATARVLTGTLTQLNACFASANRPTYTTAANATANVNMTVTSSDNGNTGSGGALGDTDVVTLTVTAVNDPPVNTVPAAIAVTEDVATGLSGISFADVDIGSGNLQVTLGVSSGSISSPTCTGVSAGGTTTARVLTGTLAQVNACFAGASRPTFLTAANATADVTLTVTSADNGNTGTGGERTDTDTVLLDVTAVNDPPTVTLPTVIPIQVPGTTPLRAIAVADVDSAGAAVTVTMTVPVGTLGASSGGGVTVVGSGSPTVILTGNIANLAAFLDADLVSYSAGDDTTLTVTINDMGNTGSGGAQSSVAMTPLVGDAIFSNNFE